MGDEGSSLHVLEIWRLRCLRSTQGHYKSVGLFRSLDLVLTVSNVAFSIGVLALSSASWIIKADISWLANDISLVAVLTVITSVLQYILDFRGRWKDHERAAASYGKMNREFEAIRAKDAVGDIDLDALKETLNNLGEVSPTIPWIISALNAQKKIKEDLDTLEAALVLRLG